MFLQTENRVLAAEFSDTFSEESLIEFFGNYKTLGNGGDPSIWGTIYSLEIMWGKINQNSLKSFLNPPGWKKWHHWMLKSLYSVNYPCVDLVSLLTSSPLTKIGIICTQVLQEEKILLMIPRTEWSAQWSLKYARKCSEIWVKTHNKIACNYTWLLCDAFSEFFELEASLVEG